MQQDPYFGGFDVEKSFNNFSEALETSNPTTKDTPESVQNIRKNFSSAKKGGEINDVLSEINKLGGSGSQYTYGQPAMTPEKASFEQINYNTGELYGELSNGENIKKFDTYTPGIDNNEWHAQNQSTFDKWKNGAFKAFHQFNTGVIGGTVGGIYGILNGIKEGSLSATYDNDFMNWLDLQDEKLKFTMPNFKTKEEQNMSFGEGLGTANFWAEDVLGGMAFTASAIATELVWSYATGGTGSAIAAERIALRGAKLFGKAADKAADIAKIGAKVNKVEDLVKIGARAKAMSVKPLADMTRNSLLNMRGTITAGKIGQGANVLRSAYTGAGYEAGFEARSYMREMRENFEQQWLNTNGVAPTEAEKEQFEENLKDTANGLFAYNLAIVGSSNIAQFGSLVGLKMPSVFGNSEKYFNRKIFGSGVKLVGNAPQAIKANRLQKIGQYAYSLGKGTVIEGAWEEGMQSVGKNTAQNIMQQGYDQKFANESYELVKAFGQAMNKTYNTEEGLREVYTGMIIGGLTGNAIGVYQNKTLNHEFAKTNNRAKTIEENFGKNATYSSKVALENMLMSNRVVASKKAEENANRDGDWLGGNIARSNTMFAQFQRASALDYFDETIDSNIQQIDLLDEQTLMKENGITLEQAKQLKDSMKEEYQVQAESFKRVSEFSNYFIGNKINKQEKAEIEKHLENKGYSAEEAKKVSSDVLRQALTYELYAGEVAHKHSDEMLQAFQNNLQNVLGSSRIRQAFSINDVLNKSTESTKRKFRDTKKNLEKTLIEFDTIEKKYKELENILNTKTTPEGRQAVVSQLSALQLKRDELNEKKTNLQNEINVLYNSAKMENPFGENKTEEFIPTEDILSIENNINTVLKTIEEYKKTNPQKAEVMLKLLREYEKSVGAFKTYSKRTSQIIEGNVGLRGRQNIFSELFKDKTPKQSTIDMIKGLLDTHYTAKDTLTSVIDELTQEVAQAQPTQTANGVDMVANKVETKNPVSNKEFIIEQIKKHPYLFSQVGEEYESALPTENEIGEYYALATQEDLSEEEAQRLEELNTKMANWQLLEAVDGGGVTIAEMILQDIQNNEEITETEEDTFSEEDLAKVIENGEPEATSGQRPLNILQTIKNVFIKRKDKNTWSISHLTPKGFFNLIGQTGQVKYYYTKKNKKGETVIDGNVLTTTVDSINDFVKVGMVIDFGNTQIKITDGNKLEVKDSDLNPTVFRKRQTKSGYSILFDGEGKAMTSDFQDVNTISDEEIYNLSEKERLVMKIDMNDPYNEALQGQDDETIERNVKISLYRENGTKVGELKAQYESDQAEDSFQKIRQAAAVAFKESNEDVIDLGSVEHSYVFLGAPNLKLDENNKEEQFEINPEKIVTYGYWSGSSLTLKEKLKVKTDLLKGIDKKIPVVVIKQGNFLVAYPVTLNKIPSQKGDTIMNSGASEAQIAIEFNKVLKQEGKKPSGLFYLSPDNQNFYNEDGTLTDKFNESLERVNNIPVKNKDWLDKEHKKEQLKEEATINIDLEFRALLSPKIVISTDSFEEFKLDVITEEQATIMVNDFINKKKALPIKRKRSSGNFLYKKGLEHFFIENNPFGEGLITFVSDDTGYSREHREWSANPTQETLDNLLKKKATRVKIQDEKLFPISKIEEVELMEKEINSNPKLKQKFEEVTNLSRSKQNIANNNKKC